MSKSLRLVIGLVCFALATTTAAAMTGRLNAAAAQSDRERFVGAWRLARLKEPGADGRVRSVDCTGQFVFTRDGYASVQVIQTSTRPPGRVNFTALCSRFQSTCCTLRPSA